MDEGGNSSRRSMPLSALALAGFSATWAFSFALVYTFAFLPSSALDATQADASRLLYLLFISAAQGAIALGTGKLLEKSFRVPLAIAAGLVAVVATASYFPAATLGGGWSYAIVLSLAGAAQGTLHVLWTESLTFFDHNEGCRIVYGSVAVGALVFMAVMLVAGSLAPAVVAVLSAVSAALYLPTARHMNAAPLSRDMMSRKLSKGLRKGTATLAVFGAVFGASIYACLSPGFGAATVDYAAIGAAICCGAGIPLLLNVFASKTFRLNEVVSALSPVLAVVLLAQVYLGTGSSGIVYPLLLGILTAFDATAFCFLLRAAYELGLCPLHFVARGRFVIQSGMFFSALVYHLLASFGSSDPANGMLMPLVLIGFLFVAMSTSSRVDFIPRALVDKPLAPLEERDDETDGEEAEGPAKAVEPIDIETRMADDYDLSARELDVLRLIDSGYTMSGVAEKLVISQNTVKSHYYHIYRKMGVNSKKEVIGIRDQYLARYGAE